MTNRLRNIPLCLLALAIVTPTASQAQQYYAARNDQVVAPAALPQAQLDALLAPIALYPDQLLAQVLMAATCPDNVADAARLVRENPSLTGAALDQALQGQNWDPSVLSLAAYPQVLQMMSSMPDWTQQLGQAFLANQQQVMDTVQMLRTRAQGAGYLQSTPQQTVIDQGGAIDIEPAQPQYVYVPVYDPTVIYGSWSEPYVPPYWYPPAIYGYPDFAPGFAAAIFFGRPCKVDDNHWNWARPNWREHDIAVNVTHNYFANRPQYANRWRDGRWAPSLEQRHNAGYRDNGAQWARPGNAGFQPREPSRVHDSLPMQQQISRAVPQSQSSHQETARPLSGAQPYMPSSQWRQSSPRPLQLQQTYARPTPPQPIARTLQPASTVARPMQQPQQGRWRAPQQSVYAVAHPTPRLPQTIARPLPQQPPRQTMTRELPQFREPPSQSFARSVPQPREIANPMVQRSAPQVAYNPPARAPIQMAANHAQERDASRGAPNHMTTNSRSAQERDHR